MTDVGNLQGVRDGYDRWAGLYDAEDNPLVALEEPVMREAIGDVASLDVLDLGCGTGRHTLWLASRGAAVTALDFSEGMLSLARRKPGAEAVRFIVHDLSLPLPLRDAAFDVAVSGLVVEHLADFDTFFAQMRRVLRPGGRAVVSAMHPAMFLRGAWARFVDPSTGEKVAPGSRVHTLGDLVMAAVRGGFTLEAIRERAPDEALAVQRPRLAKWVGWPMLVVMRMRVP